MKKKNFCLGRCLYDAELIVLPRIGPPIRALKPLISLAKLWERGGEKVWRQSSDRESLVKKADIAEDDQLGRLSFQILASERMSLFKLFWFGGLEWCACQIVCALSCGFKLKFEAIFERWWWGCQAENWQSCSLTRCTWLWMKIDRIEA